MPIFLASDHSGVRTKDVIIDFLRYSQPRNWEPCDLGTYSKDAVDYVDYAKQLAHIIGEEWHYESRLGILICGTGVGMSIVANKVPGVRAALVHNKESATKSKEHNDANVICLGSWINSDSENVGLVDLWLNQKFGEHRHVSRIEKISPNPTSKIVFTNGCFDIIHAGHLHLLKFAKLLGDHLVVGLNTDKTVNELKGPGHPVNTEADRKAVLESLRYVDEVVVFDEYRPSNLIRTLNPHIVVRGGEHTADEIRERDEVPEHIVVKICPLLDKQTYGTSKIMQKIKEG